eukprot:Skav219153  [mRNA]  locus=scaffold1574:844926:845414:- [translate_table: standard]
MASEATALIKKVSSAGDDYRILGIQTGASDDAIKKAYKTLAFRLHPDKCKECGAEEAFKKVVEAFSALSGKDKKILIQEDETCPLVPQKFPRSYSKRFAQQQERDKRKEQQEKALDDANALWIEEELPAIKQTKKKKGKALVKEAATSSISMLWIVVVFSGF